MSQIFQLILLLLFFQIKINYACFLLLKCVDLFKKKKSMHVCIDHGSDAAIIPKPLKEFYNININQTNYADSIVWQLLLLMQYQKNKNKKLCVTSQSYCFNKAMLFFSCRIHLAPHCNLLFLLFFFLQKCINIKKKTFF